MPFTQSYSQPDDYHFCQDSLLAPVAIAADIAKTFAHGPATEVPLSILDVCAGCGVMGYELLHALKALDTTVNEIDFLEIQSAFETHVKANAEALKVKPRFHLASYAELANEAYRHRYDIIVANPPYFEKGEGSLGDSELSNRARFFIDDSMTTLLKGIRNALKPDGAAYVLMKSGKKHGRDAFTSARIELFDCRLERLADIRGTDLIKITAS